MGKKNNINKVIGLAIVHYPNLTKDKLMNGPYVILKKDLTRRDFVPDGPPKNIKDLYHLIDGGKLSYITLDAQKTFLERCNSKKIGKKVKNMSVVDLSKYFK